MSRVHLTKSAVATIVLALLAVSVWAENPQAGAVVERTDEQLMVEVSRLAKDIQRRCEFVAEPVSGKKLVAQSDPILRWSNPTAGRVFGDVCVWTDNGRPKLVACIYRFFSPDWGATLEVCSLTDKLTGQIGSNQFWSPNTTGMKRQPLQAAEAPANSAPARLIQMRRMAVDFAAHLDDTRGTKSGVARQLRLLTKPLYRYPALNIQDSRSDYVDGALFAFVEGTDPEVLLVLEANRAGDSVRWDFGLARMNRDAMHVTFRNQMVWSVPYLENQLSQMTEPYSLFSLEQPPLNQVK